MRTWLPQSLVMSSLSDVSRATGFVWRSATSATVVSMAYLCPCSATPVGASRVDGRRGRLRRHAGRGCLDGARHAAPADPPRAFRLCAWLSQSVRRGQAKHRARTALRGCGQQCTGQRPGQQAGAEEFSAQMPGRCLGDLAPMRLVAVKASMLTAARWGDAHARCPSAPNGRRTDGTEPILGLMLRGGPVGNV